MQRRMAVIGPLASIGFGLLLGGHRARLRARHQPGRRGRGSRRSHLLRAMVWLNLLLGAINLLPALPLDGGRVFRVAPGRRARRQRIAAVAARQAQRSARASALGLGGGLGQWIAIALVIAGLLLGNLWLVIMGAFVLIGAHMENQGLLVQNDVDTVRMRDVMLTQFSTLSASDTLEDALQRAVHTHAGCLPRGARRQPGGRGLPPEHRRGAGRQTATATCRAS